MKERIFKFLTIASCICVIASVGGLEQGMFGAISCLVRIGIFCVLAVIFGSLVVKDV